MFPAFKRSLTLSGTPYVPPGRRPSHTGRSSEQRVSVLRVTPSLRALAIPGGISRKPSLTCTGVVDPQPWRFRRFAVPPGRRCDCTKPTRTCEITGCRGLRKNPPHCTIRSPRHSTSCMRSAAGKTSDLNSKLLTGTPSGHSFGSLVDVWDKPLEVLSATQAEALFDSTVVQGQSFSEAADAARAEVPRGYSATQARVTTGSGRSRPRHAPAP